MGRHEEYLCDKIEELIRLRDEGAPEEEQDRVEQHIVSIISETALLSLQSYGPSGGRFNGSSAIHRAARGGLTRICQRLLDKGFDANAGIEAANYLPLHLAVMKGHVETAGLLLDRGAKVNASDHEGPPLKKAIKAGNIKLCDLLLSHGADVDMKDRAGKPLLNQAARYGRVDMIERLLARGADIDATDGKGMDALCQAVKNKYTGIVKMLLDAGIRFDRDHCRAMDVAIEEESDDLVNRLLELVPDPVLSGSLSLKYEQRLEELLALGVPAESFRVFASQMYRPLYQDDELTEGERCEMLSRLLGHGLDPVAADGYGDTLLHRVCRMRPSCNDIDILIQGGAGQGINTRNDFGETALHAYVSVSSATDIPKPTVDGLESLLDAGADITIRNRYGKTPMDLLQTWSAEEARPLIRRLEAHAIDKTAEAGNQMTCRNNLG